MSVPPFASSSIPAPALPPTQIVDDADDWLVVERFDVDDSDADTQDSNAEGFYAHDYPGGCEAAVQRLQRAAWRGVYMWPCGTAWGRGTRVVVGGGSRGAAGGLAPRVVMQLHLCCPPRCPPLPLLQPFCRS